jgi:uncharacterized protein
MMTRVLVYALLVVLMVSVVINYIQYNQSNILQQIVTDYKKQNDYYLEKLSKIASEKPAVQQNQSSPSVINFHNLNNTNLESISAVAVSPVLQSDGFFETTTYVGTVLKITSEIRDGSGLVLVNTAVPTGVDFQTSARTAVNIAQKITMVDLSKKDVIFSIFSENNQELQAVDGGSAGGAMTVLLILNVSGKPINNKILMTGTIEQDGSIGEIGGVSQKADAAGKYGAKIFLVPKGQGVTQIESCDEKREGAFIYRSCTLQDKPLSPITESQYGMKVIEVDNIREALGYFNSNQTQ